MLFLCILWNDSLAYTACFCFSKFNSKVFALLFLCKSVDFFFQVINARHNSLKNHGVPSEMFKLDDLLTVVILSILQKLL